MRIKYSKEFIELYDLISYNSLKNISLLDFDSEMFSKMSLFENYIISMRIIDMCSLQQTVEGGVEIILNNTSKKIKKMLDVFIESSLSNTYFNNDRWDVLVRLRGMPSMNTKTGYVEDNKQKLMDWKRVRESNSYNYAKYILNNLLEGRKLPSKVSYSAGMDLVSDLEYFFIGSIYYLFIEETMENISEKKKIFFLSLIAEHLKLHTYKRWEKRKLIDYFLEESK